MFSKWKLIVMKGGKRIKKVGFPNRIEMFLWMDDHRDLGDKYIYRASRKESRKFIEKAGWGCSKEEIAEINLRREEKKLTS